MSSVNNTLAVLTAALFAAVFSASAFAANPAGEGSLSINEAAAQRAIVDTASFDRTAIAPVANDSTLAHNEDAAQRAIVDTRGRDGRALSSAIGEATLERNELAAQRAIAGVPARARATGSDRSVSGVGVVTKPVAAR